MSILISAATPLSIPISAATPQCATRTGSLIGAVILLVLVLAILACAVGWARASNRAHRAEATLAAIRGDRPPPPSGWDPGA